MPFLNGYSKIPYCSMFISAYSYSINMDEISYFVNGLRCKEHHHGASCAVDALNELFYYGVWSVGEKVHTVHGEMFSLLNKICIERKALDKVSCVLRENIWDWLVRKLPGAYSPKGRMNAEIICGIELMCQELKECFSTTICGLFSCENCGSMKEITLPLVMLTFA